MADEGYSAEMLPVSDNDLHVDADTADSQQNAWTSPEKTVSQFDDSLHSHPQSRDSLPSLDTASAALTRYYFERFAEEEWDSSTGLISPPAKVSLSQLSSSLWPPSPLVEDERASLAKEFEPPQEIDSVTYETKARGTLEQQPIIQDANIFVSSVNVENFSKPMGSKQATHICYQENGEICGENKTKVEIKRAKPHMKLSLENLGSVSLDRRTPSPYTFTPKVPLSTRLAPADSGYFLRTHENKKTPTELFSTSPAFREHTISDALRGQGKSRHSTSGCGRFKSGDLVKEHERDFTRTSGQNNYDPDSIRRQKRTEHHEGPICSRSAYRQEQINELRSTKENSATPQITGSPSIKNVSAYPQKQNSKNYHTRGGLTSASSAQTLDSISSTADHFSQSHETPASRLGKLSSRIANHNLPPRTEATKAAQANHCCRQRISPEALIFSSPSSSQSLNARDICNRFCTSCKTEAGGSNPAPSNDLSLRTLYDPGFTVSVRSPPHNTIQTINDHLPYPQEESRLMPSENQHTSFLRSVLDRLDSAKPNDSALRKNQEARPVIPCPLKDSGIIPDGWYTASNFRVCAKCWEYYFGNSSRSFQFRYHRSTDEDSSKACDMASIWMRITWTHAMNTGRAAPEAVFDQVRICIAQAPCPGRHLDIRDWATVVSGRNATVKGFNICPRDKARLETLMPSLKGLFRPDHSSKNRKRRCDFRTDSVRFDKYMSLLMEIDAGSLTEGKVSPTLPDFVQLAQLKAGTQECLRDTLASDCRWHFLSQLPEFYICEDCYTEVVWPAIENGYPLACCVDQTPRYIREEPSTDRIRSNPYTAGASCQLYSERMRQIWFDALQHNDFGYLRRKVLERRKLEAEMRRQSADLHGALSELETSDDTLRHQSKRLHSNLERVMNKWRMWQ